MSPFSVCFFTFWKMTKQDRSRQNFYLIWIYLNYQIYHANVLHCCLCKSKSQSKHWQTLNYFRHVFRVCINTYSITRKTIGEQFYQKTMSRNLVMSPTIVSFNNVSFSLVHGLHCQRYNGIHCPTGPQIGLRPPTALSIHSLHTGELCGLLEPTSSFSTTAFCCYMGVVPNALSILVPSQHLLRGSVTPCQMLSVRECCYKGLWWAITSLSCETKEEEKKKLP